VKPDALAREAFHARVKALCGWFSALSPYRHEPNLLKIEDENYPTDENGRPIEGALRPLFGHGISSKRYCLFNRDETGAPIIRKFSAHGLGRWSILST
jgi:hypothetical protein